MKEIKKCKYHNCNKVIDGRPNKRFCNDNCRKYFHIYLKRENDKLKSEKKIIRDLIQEAKLLEDKNLIELYKIIYR